MRYIIDNVYPAFPKGCRSVLFQVSHSQYKEANMVRIKPGYYRGSIVVHVILLSNQAEKNVDRFGSN